MRSVLLPLAACAILGGCAAYDAPYAPGYGYGYPPAVGYGYPPPAGYYYPPPAGYYYPPPAGYYGYDYYYGEPLLLDGRPAYRHRDRDRNGRHDGGRPGRGGGRRDVDGSGGSGWSPGNEPGAMNTPSGSGGSGWSPADIGKPGPTNSGR